MTSTVFTTYTDPQNRRCDWTANNTRDIVNAFPDYHTFRRDVNSKGFKFLNGLAGQELANLEDLLNRGLQDSFLPTMNLDAPSHQWSVLLSGNHNLFEPQNTYNLLRNSSFELRSTHTWFGDWWDWDGNGLVDLAAGNRSNTSVYLDGSIIAQPINRVLRGNEPVTLSLWYKGGGSSTTAYVRLTLANASTQDLSITLTNQADWTFASVTQNTRTQDIVNMHVYIDGADGVYIDDIQLAVSQSASSWKPNIFDVYHSMELPSYSPVFTNYPYYVQYVGEVSEDLEATNNWFYAPPTRCWRYAQESYSGLSRLDEFPIGNQTDFWKDRIPVGLRKNGNYIQRYSIAQDDEYVNYSLRFLTLDGRFVAKDYTLECFTVFRDTVWAVVQMDDWNGATARYLAIAPIAAEHTGVDTPSTQTDYFEVICDLKLPSEREVFRISFLDQDINLVHLYDGHFHDTLKLEYDYFVLDRNEGELVYRNNYNNLSIGFQNDRRRQ